MKKFQTTYYHYYPNREDMIHITVDENDRLSLHDHSEPCSGILRHWGTRDELKKELQEIIKIIDETP